MNDLPWLLRLIFRTDLFLINRVFMPLAHWIDWRFHYSPYQQAYVVMAVGMAMNAASTIVSFIQIPTWFGAIGPLSSMIIFWAFRFYFKKFEQAQRQYETRPDVLCWAQMFFMGPHMAFPRVGFILLGSQLGVFVAMSSLLPPVRLLDPLNAVLGFWMLLFGVALYLAGAFPPQRPRREKRTLAVLRPAPVGA